MPIMPDNHRPPQAGAQHRAKAAPSDDWRQWYTHSRWRRIRKRHLNSNPLCVYCRDQGKVEVAEVVDHIQPHRGNKARFFAGPFQSLCKPCHDSAKKREENNMDIHSAAPREPGFA